MKQSLLLYVSTALLAVSCQTPPAPASTPLAGQASAEPTVLATNAPAPVADVTPQATLGQFRGRDECQSGPEFELSYALDTWDLQDASLVHRAFSDCTLLLAAHGQQVSGPKVEQRKDLAGHSWEVSLFPNEGLASYWLEEGGGCYLFGVEYSQQSPDEAAEQCQQAAESVIDSFKLLDQ